MAVGCSGLREGFRATAIAGVIAFLLGASLLSAGARAAQGGLAGPFAPVAGTCGKTTVGAVADQLISNQKRVNQCKLPVNATVTELVFYLAPTSHSGEQLIKGVFYADSKGRPAALLGETGKFKFSSKEAAGWHHFVMLTPLKLVAGTYWMGVITGTTTKVAGERYDKVANAEDYDNNSYSSGASNPFGTFKTNNEQMSLYAVYTPEEARKSGVTIEKLQKIGTGSYTKSELAGKVGETVNYEIVVTNTGETTLTLSNFTDAKCRNTSGGPGTLEAAKSTTWLCEHKLSETGKYSNSASVEANEGVGKKESNTVAVNAEGRSSSLTIEKLQKVGSSEFTKSELSAKLGETVSYETVVTNTGETKLTLSNFTDAKCSNVSGGAGTLEAGKSTTWLCEHKLSEAGKYSNSASVEANEGVGKKESNTVTVKAELPKGSCEPSSSLAALLFGKDVLAYVPKGAWEEPPEVTTGVSVVNAEGNAITPAKIETKSVVNSCASNSQTGVTVCTANNTDVYVIKEAKVEHELTSGASGTIAFSGGQCTNCGVSMDSVHDRALIGLSLEGKPAFQFLNLATLEFEKPFVAASGKISEDPLLDPTRELILSPAENGTYEIVNLAKSSEPAFFENSVGGLLDSAGADCSTGIALATEEFGSSLYLADLTQAKYTPGSPAGTWSAPSQLQPLEETGVGSHVSGVAVAQGTHTGVVAAEFGGKNIIAIALPETSGSGTPALRDYLTCAIGSEFQQGLDPHTVTAYQSPNGGDAIGLFGNVGGSILAKVDLTKMLNPSIVKRTAGGHACGAGTLPEAVESFISVP